MRDVVFCLNLTVLFHVLKERTADVFEMYVFYMIPRVCFLLESHGLVSLFEIEKKRSQLTYST